MYMHPSGAAHIGSPWAEAVLQPQAAPVKMTNRGLRSNAIIPYKMLDSV